MVIFRSVTPMGARDLIGTWPSDGGVFDACRRHRGVPSRHHLVGDWPTPLENDGVRQLGWWICPIYIYIYMEKKRQNSLNVMFQTTNQIHVFVSILQDHPWLGSFGVTHKGLETSISPSLILVLIMLGIDISCTEIFLANVWQSFIVTVSNHYWFDRQRCGNLMIHMDYDLHDLFMWGRTGIFSQIQSSKCSKVQNNELI